MQKTPVIDKSGKIIGKYMLQVAAAIKAIHELNKMNGDYAPVKVNVEVNIVNHVQILQTDRARAKKITKIVQIIKCRFTTYRF